jgi:hypothetical protein
MGLKLPSCIEMPTLWQSHEDGIVKLSLWESLSVIHLATLEV